MEGYESEEQQIEAVKRWWKENGTSLILGAAIGLGGIAGWKYYQEGQEAHKVEASNLYVALTNQVAAKTEAAELNVMADRLATGYADTPYAAMASLVLAKNDYESGNVQGAISKLSWASKNAQDVETQQVASTRLIRVYISEDMFDEAESLLGKQHPESFAATYEELRGDLLVAKDDSAGARSAYDTAIELSAEKQNGWLELKRKNLGD